METISLNLHKRKLLLIGNYKCYRAIADEKDGQRKIKLIKTFLIVCQGFFLNFHFLVVVGQLSRGLKIR